LCENEHDTGTENMTPKEKQKVLFKLHTQFGHASVDRLKKLLACSGDAECTTILKDIVKKTETCIRYSKPKPALGLPMASTYRSLTPVRMDVNECWWWSEGP